MPIIIYYFFEFTRLIGLIKADIVFSAPSGGPCPFCASLAILRNSDFGRTSSLLWFCPLWISLEVDKNSRNAILGLKSLGFFNTLITKLRFSGEGTGWKIEEKDWRSRRIWFRRQWWENHIWGSRVQDSQIVQKAKNHDIFLIFTKCFIGSWTGIYSCTFI